MTARELFVEELATRAQTLAVQAPALALLRKSAQLEELPAGKLESFKYTPIESLYDAALADPEPRTVGTDVPEAPLVADGNSFELPVSGIDIDADALPPGLSAHSLAEAILDQEGLDLQRLNAGLDVVRYPLVHLNTSLIQDGLVVRIAPGRRVASRELCSLVSKFCIFHVP